MRPILKSFVYFDRHPDGVYFRNGSDVLVIKGRGIYSVVARILNLFDGSHDVDLLSSQLPEKLRPILDLLMRELGSRDFIVDAGPSPKPLATAGVSNSMPIAFLADHRPEPVQAFAEWQSRPLLIVGGGSVADATLTALSGLGVSKLYHFDPGGTATSEGPVEVIYDEQIGSLDFHVCLYASDSVDFESLSALPEEARPSLVAGQIGSHVVVAAGDRLRNSSIVEDLDRSHGAALVPPSSAQMVLAGNLLAHEWFLQSTEVSSEALPLCRIVRSDLSVENVAYDPLADTGSTLPPKHPDRELTPFELFWDGLRPLFSETTGIFRLIEDQDLLQVPLFQRELELVGNDETVRAWGLGVEEATRRMVSHAVERHIALMDDQELLVGVGFSQDEARARLCAAAAYSSSDKRGKAKFRQVSPEELTDETMVLWRITQQISDQNLGMRVLTWPNQLGAIAELHGEDEIVAREPAATKDQAVREALSSYCGSWQAGTRAEPYHMSSPQPGAKEIAISTFEKFGVFAMAIPATKGQ